MQAFNTTEREAAAAAELWAWSPAAAFSDSGAAVHTTLRAALSHGRAQAALQGRALGGHQAAGETGQLSWCALEWELLQRLPPDDAACAAIVPQLATHWFAGEASDPR